MFHLADVQTTCMLLYDFCVSITAVCGTVFVSWSFSLHHWFTIHSTPETKIVEKTIDVFICMYVKLVNSDAKHSKI